MEDLKTIHQVTRPIRSGNDIKSSNTKTYTYYPIVVIGAGESGICMGARLRQVLGFDQFRIFDRRSGLGGTWHANTYPGIACDVPALMYSFSFAQNPNWTGVLPPGPEILQYLKDVAGRFGILDKIQCDTNIKNVRWIEEDEEWELVLEVLVPGIGDMSSAERAALEAEKGVESTTLRIETIRAKIVTSAAGGLVEPKAHIKVPGIENFKGKIVHTARWDSSIEFRDKNVIVLGTGCSAAQVVPQLITEKYGPAKHVTQLLRSPPWTVPFLNEKGKQTWTKWVKRVAKVPGLQNVLRKLAFGINELTWYQLFEATETARQRRIVQGAKVLKYMKRVVPEEYHEILTPDYELFCKRRIIDDGWFRSFRDPRVDISSQPLTAMDETTITLGPGRYFPPESQTDSKAPTDMRKLPCDVLVFANGYQTNEWLHPLDVQGRAGKSLHQEWKTRGGAQAYMGMAMDGFPNFFMVFGPNTANGHTSVILASENMTNYILNFVNPILNRDVTTVEVTRDAQENYTKRVQSDLKNSLYQTGGCASWYHDRETGWNSTLYPRSQIDFTFRCMFPVWSHWDIKYTSRGLTKLWMRRVVRTVVFVSLLAGAVWWRKVGTDVVKRAVVGWLHDIKTRLF